jgi:hypothetical protein
LHQFYREPCRKLNMSSIRRSRPSGVRFAADENDGSESIAITLGDPIARSVLAAAAAADDVLSAATPVETDGEADAGDGLHIGGLQILQRAMSNDEGISRPDSDADGPLDVPLGTTPDLDRSIVRGEAHSGDEGRPEVALGSTGGLGGRRHHRAQTGKPAKANKSSKQSMALRTWLRIDKNGETSLLQVRACTLSRTLPSGSDARATQWTGRAALSMALGICACGVSRATGSPWATKLQRLEVEWTDGLPVDGAKRGVIPMKPGGWRLPDGKKGRVKGTVSLCATALLLRGFDRETGRKWFKGQYVPSRGGRCMGRCAEW